MGGGGGQQLAEGWWSAGEGARRRGVAASRGQGGQRGGDADGAARLLMQNTEGVRMAPSRSGRDKDRIQIGCN